MKILFVAIHKSQIVLRRATREIRKPNGRNACSMLHAPCKELEQRRLERTRAMADGVDEQHSPEATRESRPSTRRKSVKQRKWPPEPEDRDEAQSHRATYYMGGSGGAAGAGRVAI